MSDHSMTGTATDAIELLTSQHREVEQLWSQLQSGAGGQELREELTRRLIAAISQHDAIETQILYPAVREVPGGDQLADHSLEEHQRVREQLKEVDRGSIADADTLATLTVAMQSVLHHSHEEEAEILPRLRERYSPEDLQRLGSTLADAMATASTHPHPSTPNNPVGAAVAGTVAGLVDKARDAMHRDG